MDQPFEARLTRSMRFALILGSIPMRGQSRLIPLLLLGTTLAIMVSSSFSQDISQFHREKEHIASRGYELIHVGRAYCDQAGASETARFKKAFAKFRNNNREFGRQVEEYPLHEATRRLMADLIETSKTGRGLERFDFNLVEHNKSLCDSTLWLLESFSDSEEGRKLLLDQAIKLKQE